MFRKTRVQLIRTLIDRELSLRHEAPDEEHRAQCRVLNARFRPLPVVVGGCRRGRDH